MIYKCLKCSYISPLKTNVTRHIVSKHRDDVETLIESSENMESVCQNMEKNGKNVEKSSKNMELIDNNLALNKTLFQCEKCTKILANNKSLKYHSNICKGVKNSLECYKCHKIFNTSSAKCKHLKICKEENTNNIELLKDTNLELSKDSNLEKIYIKQKIPQSVRITVWDTYIGRSIGEKLCNICNTNKISQFNFHCGHVIAERNGGKTSINNLRPICKSCNSSMRTMNLDDFKLKFFN